MINVASLPVTVLFTLAPRWFPANDAPQPAPTTPVIDGAGS